MSDERETHHDCRWIKRAVASDEWLVTRKTDRADIVASWGAACLRQAGHSIPRSGISG